MKKLLTLFLMVGSFVLWIGLSFEGCSSNPTAAGPITITQGVPTATPFCGSPSSQGLTTAGLGGGAFGQSIETQAVTFASNETATSMSLYIASGPVTGQVRFAIYGDNGSNYPANLVVETNPQNLVSGSWNTVSLPNVYLPAGVYHLAFLTSNIVSQPYVTSGWLNYYHSYSWGVFPDTFPGSAPSDAWGFSFYVSVCP